MRIYSAALLICLYFVLLALSYARAMPPFEAADEAAHFLYTHNLLEDRALPRIINRQAVAAQADPVQRWAIESHQPPLYYAFGALLISPTNRDDVNAYLRTNNVIFTRGVTENNHNKWLHTPGDTGGDTGTAIWILRLYSISLGVATLWLIFLTARQISDKPLIPLAAMMFTASIPTFVSISASINNDNLVTTLYAAGIYLSVRVWKRQSITNRDLMALCAVLSLIALAKLTGLSLFGVVFVVLLVGVYRGYWTHARALRSAVIMLACAGIIAGWWYVRNWSLYGDPLALSATRSLWGREFEIAATSGDIGAELQRIAQSFWMMFGHLHLPVYGPDWVYIYALVMTVLGVVGVMVAIHRVRKSESRFQLDALLLLVGVCALIMLMLLVGTRSVDISYGRLLFPALIGFAPLMVMGWTRLFRGAGLLLILPLLYITFITPADVISRAYPTIQTVEQPAENARIENARTVNAAAGGMTIVAYRNLKPVSPGEDVVLDLYLRGHDATNPLLTVTAVDSITLERLGYGEMYPGIAPMDALDPDQLYKARVRFALDEVGDAPLSPRMLLLRFEWRPPDEDDPLAWADGSGQPIERLLVNGPTLHDPRYVARYDAPQPDHTARVDFTAQNGQIALAGYSLPDETLNAGDDLNLTLHWAGGTTLDDWTLTVQLHDEAGNLITQSDAPLPGYPTTSWLPDVPFASEHTLQIPADTPPGDYCLLLGWYRQIDDTFVRMTASDDVDGDGLFVIPQPITVE